jgi:predicted SnoaL-like aldol condensation-catalyzing enzyme
MMQVLKVEVLQIAKLMQVPMTAQVRKTTLVVFFTAFFKKKPELLQ